MKPLWSHQEAAIHSLRDALRSGSKRPVLQLPTGAGKTRVAAEIIKMAMAKNSRVIFTCPAISLIDQTARAFYEQGIHEVGVIQASHPMTDGSKPVQVASVQTLARRQIPPAKLVIVDEAHRLSKFVTEWMGMDEWAHIPFIGLSATPWAKGMGRLYDRLIIGATLRELIDAGHLSDFRVFAPSKPDLSKVRTVMGDYHEGDLSDVMSDNTLTADIVATWLEKAEGRPTLVFAVDRAHAAKLQAKFESAGVHAGYIDMNTPIPERERIGRALAKGEYKVVCNVGTLTTGVDWDVRCIVLARPTKSEILFVQIIGRALRTAPGKDYALILDHSNTTMKLGFVTDIQHFRLSGANMAEGSEKETVVEKPTPKPWDCPKCKRVVPVGQRVCECGFQRVRQSDIETMPGELVELDPKRKAKENREAGWPEKISFIAQLRTFAIEKGKNDGWVSGRYKSRFGAWPNDPKVRYAKPAAEVSPAVRSFIHSQNIAYAKMMERKRNVR